MRICVITNDLSTRFLVSVVICYIFVLTFGWKARHLQDGYYIRQELTYIACVIIMVGISATLTFSIGDPIFIFLLWFFDNLGVVVLSVYPVALSYGCINFQPFLPWTWFCCLHCREDRRALESPERVDDLELMDILTNEDYKVSNVQCFVFTRHCRYV